MFSVDRAKQQLRVGGGRWKVDRGNGSCFITEIPPAFQIFSRQENLSLRILICYASQSVPIHLTRTGTPEPTPSRWGGNLNSARKKLADKNSRQTIKPELSPPPRIV